EETNPLGAQSFQVKDDAPNQTPSDIPHEFDDIGMQLTGTGTPGIPFSYAGATVDNLGFVYSFAQDRGAACGSKIGPPPPDILNLPMRCHGTDCVPVLRTLAKEFIVCDNWHAPLPGPTWPNRFFVHAASSGGLANSPSTPGVVGTEFNVYAQDTDQFPGLRG